VTYETTPNQHWARAYVFWQWTHCERSSTNEPFHYIYIWTEKNKKSADLKI